ncbi:MAG: Fe-S cluster assembly protein SufD [Gammaproteobacteria bacterium]|nr:Fe-S cluster assembly protein SufD [Gammaproteobacteria bacterium]
MNTQTNLAEQWLKQIVDKAVKDPDSEQAEWFEKMRTNAQHQLQDYITPNRKQELWKYSNIDSLFKNQYSPVDEALLAISQLDIEEHFITDIDTYRLVLTNGRFVPHLSNIQNLPQGVKLGGLRDTLKTDAQSMAGWFGHAASHYQHVFSALNTALINDGLFLKIEDGIKLEKPIEVINISLSVDEPLLIQPRNLCVLGKAASATLIERYISTGDSHYLNNNLTELVLEENASLLHYRLQEESSTAYHLGSVFLSQHASSVYNNTSISLGGAWSRTEFNVEFKAEFAACHLNGLYMVGDDQTQDFHLNIRHDVANCSSTENFKGILYGKGRAIFDGLIYVAKDAQKTEAHLSNKNLMLSRQAEIDSKPQLEIYADDVKCSHGTSIGQLEPEQIFYLRSRGISEQVAKKMLCLGFAGEIINHINIKCIQEALNKAVKKYITS